MTIEVTRTERGTAFRCDTPEEALAMARALALQAAHGAPTAPASANTPAAPVSAPAQPSTTATHWRRFTSARRRGPRDTAQPAPAEPQQLAFPTEPQHASSSTSSTLNAFWSRLDSRGRTLMHLIASNLEVSLDQMAHALGGVPTREVSAVLAACKRVAASVGLHDYRAVFDYRIVGARDERTSIYHPGPLLRGEMP